jgi:hypothetical protein
MFGSVAYLAQEYQVPGIAAAALSDCYDVMNMTVRRKPSALLTDKPNSPAVLEGDGRPVIRIERSCRSVRKRSVDSNALAGPSYG